ncbi:MAG: autotransporter assembly complex family protein [Porticoccaceae bacterium]
MILAIGVSPLLTLIPVSADTVAVVVSGGDTALRDNVQAHLGLADLACNTTELHLRGRLRGADEQISQALRALGYYHGEWRVKRERVAGKKNGNGGCWRITVELEPGPPVTVATRDVRVEGEGAADAVFTRYLASLPLAPGERLNHATYEAIKNGLVQRARTAGYFEAEFSHRALDVDTERNSADIRLVYDSGPRYRFGAISYGPSPLDEALLERFVTFAPGELFDADKLIQSQSNLINSLYFASVNLDQQRPDRERLEVPVAITTSPRSKYETTASVGFSTDTGPRVGYGLANRRVNGAGDTYLVSSQLSPVQSNLGFQYSQPGDDPLRDKTQWSTGWQREDTDTATSDSFRAEVARITMTESDWLRTLSLKYLFEDFRIAGESQSSMLLMPGIGWSKSRANDSRYPTRGWRLGSAFRVAVEGLVSDVTLAQAELDGKLVLPLVGGRLITRAGIGTTVLDDFAQLPASLRFFAGGDNSVRGFDYQTLGPEDSNGKVIGGKHQVTGSVEYDHKVWKDFALAAFVDAGTAFDTRDFTLYQSAGFGVRWFSPIGPIRVDFAFPLDEGGFRLHLSMGPDL